MKLKQDLKYSKLLLNSIPVITVVTLLVAIFSKLTANQDNINIFFSSDTLYLPSVFKDLITDKGHLKHWHFNPAPNYFPDMLFYFLLMFITNNFVVASFIFSIIQYVLLGFLCVKLFKLIFPSGSSYCNFIIYALLSFFLLEFFFFTKDFTYIFIMIVNSYHVGAFIMTLVCMFLSFKYILDKKISRLILIFSIGFLMMLSDKLFVVLYAVPICITSIFLFRKIELRTALSLIIINAVFVISGLEVSKLIDTDSYNFVGDTTKTADWDLIKSQFGTFFDQMHNILTNYGFRTITLYLFMTSLFLMAYVFVNSLRRSQPVLVSFYALFSLVFSVCVICAPMISGRYQGWDCLRYNIYPVYLSILNATVFIFYKSQTILQNSRFILIGLNVLLLGVGFSQLSVPGLKGYFNYYPDNARFVDEMAEKENLKYGVANYWEAKKITMFSKKGVKVYSVFDDVSFYNHVANDDWFFKNMFNFVLLTNFSDTTLYRDKVRDIKFLSNTPEFRIIKTRPFLYLKHTGSLVINTEIKEE